MSSAVPLLYITTENFHAYLVVNIRTSKAKGLCDNTGQQIWCTDRPTTWAHHHTWTMLLRSIYTVTATTCCVTSSEGLWLSMSLDTTEAARAGVVYHGELKQLQLLHCNTCCRINWDHLICGSTVPMHHCIRPVCVILYRRHPRMLPMPGCH